MIRRLLELALHTYHWPWWRLRRLWRKPPTHEGVTLWSEPRRVAADVRLIAWEIPAGAALYRLKMHFYPDGRRGCEQLRFFGACGLCTLAAGEPMILMCQAAAIPFFCPPAGLFPGDRPGWMDLTGRGGVPLRGGPWAFTLYFHDDPGCRWADFPGQAAVSLAVQGVVARGRPGENVAGSNCGGGHVWTRQRADANL